MIHLYVWLRTPGAAVIRAGELRVAEPDRRRGGLLRGEFRYDPAYIEHPHRPALDPLHLPLETGVFTADRPHSGLHGAFEDSLPDAWGRGLLIRRHRLRRAEQSPPHLLSRLGADGLGALAYTTEPVPPPVESPRSTPDLAALIAAAEGYEQDPDALGEGELSLLFRAASSPGGGRPKLVIEQGGVGYIAKLASKGDEVDLVRVEAACLALARDAGMAVPRFRVESFGKRAALLIERFDLAAAGGRNHCLSMQTLVGAEGYYQAGYADLADVLRRASGRPEHDIPALYRQMVFNAVLGNTDDHLKNFAMMQDGQAWRLTPAFDLTPDVPRRREHVLHFSNAGHLPDKEGVQRLAGVFGISPTGARHITAEVVAAVAGWRTRCDELGVAAPDQERIGRDIERRVSLFRAAR